MRVGDSESAGCRFQTAIAARPAALDGDMKPAIGLGQGGIAVGRLHQNQTAGAEGFCRIRRAPSRVEDALQAVVSSRGIAIGQQG